MPCNCQSSHEEGRQTMSREMIHKEVLKHEDQLRNGQITEETLRNNIREVCFVEPKVPEAAFLEVVRQYDPNFAPIPDGPERQKRAEITRKAQEGVLRQEFHIINPMHPGLKIPPEARPLRHHNILFRGGTLEEKQKMADLLYLGTKKDMGEYIYNRLGARKEELLSLLEMNDEQLVDQYFRYADDIELISELQVAMNECEFTPEQAEDIQVLMNNMSRFTVLGNRVDLMSSPYYAKYPCEQIEMSAEKSALFEVDLANLAMGAGEVVSNSTNAEYIGGPTDMLGRDYRGLQTFTLSAANIQVENYLNAFGVTFDTVSWAVPTGAISTDGLVLDKLFEQEPIFVNIPGVGVKALCNTSTNSRDCKVEEASDQVLSQYMQNRTKAVRTRAEDANPFFLSVFTGSSQYNAMLKHMKEAEKALQKLTYPLDMESDEVRKAVESIQKLEEAQKAYMKRKEDQGLERDKFGRLVGRTENEINRLAVAREAETLAKTLRFQLGYQLDPASAQQRMEKGVEAIKKQYEAEEKARKAEEMKRTAQAKKEAKPAAPATLTEEELSQSTKEQLNEFGKVYSTMQPCKGSDAGEALGKLQKELPMSVNLLAARAGMNKVLSESAQKDIRVVMAKLVLFNHALRERAANNDLNSENIIAGPVEKALNEGGAEIINKFANSDGFAKAIGKVTPARIENFLKGNEARDKEFGELVLSALFPAKAKVAENVPVQQQPEMKMEQPKAAPKVMGGP